VGLQWLCFGECEKDPQRSSAAAAPIGGSPKFPAQFFGSREPGTSNFFLSATYQPQHFYNIAKMPKSKRAKVVHLTKTDKKGKELSLKLFTNVQEAADNFEHVFVFAVENMRNSYLKEVRQEFADSRYVYSSLILGSAHG
jgi:hypothetical protein